MAPKAPTQNLLSSNVIEFEAESAIEPYRAVKAGTSPGQVVACSAITDVAIGASLNTAGAGERVQVQVGGVARMVGSAAISYGAQVMPTGAAGGKISTAAGATAKSMGLALGTTTTADGEQQLVLLATPNVNGPANA